MKTIIFILLTAVCSMTVMAQTEISPEKFMEQKPLLSAQFNEYAGKGDYQAAVKSANELIALFSQLSKVNQKRYNSLLSLSDLYYGLACCLSMLNKMEEAIDAFEEAVKYGFSNYNHANIAKHFDNIRNNQRFIALMESISENDYISILRQAGKFQSADTTGLPRFTYEASTSNNLRNVRGFFKLDSIAGDGDEISKILNLMKWVQTNIHHDGRNNDLYEFTSIDIYNYHKSTGKGVNCRHLAIVLNEMYLAMGFKSRWVSCHSKEESNTYHVINSVYSTTLKKWLWMDPTMNAYLKDENGNLLNIEEVRERLIDNRPLVLNDDAKLIYQNKQTKEGYINSWMSKYLYWFYCPIDNRFNPESNTNQTYISLCPLGYKPSSSNVRMVVTHDAAYFWEH